MYDDFRRRPKPYRWYPNTKTYSPPAHWHRWLNLYRIAPILKTLHEHGAVNEKPPPVPMPDASFLKLAACYADPARREALRALNFDLLKDDIIDLLIKVVRERNL